MRKLALAALATAAISVIGLLIATHQHGVPPAAVGAENHGAVATNRKPAPTTQPTPVARPLAAERIAFDPRRAAADWFERAQAVVAAKRVHTYGTATAALAALPPDQAWPALVQLAKNGDAGAAAAAADLILECERLRDLRARGELATRTAAPRARSLPAPWIEFTAAIDAAETARRESRADSCAGVGGTLDFVTMAIDRFIRPDNPDAQLFEAEQLADDAAAIPLLRDLAERMGSEEARRALGDRLIRSADAAESAEGLALLETLAQTDPAAIATLVSCYQSGCSGVPADPERALLWMETGAGLGDRLQAIALNKAFADAHDSAAAWAWATYALDLAASACLESGQPHAFWVQQDAQRAFDWDQALDPAQRTRAQALLQEIRARWFTQALQTLGCEP